jgi:hypothetical protein
VVSFTPRPLYPQVKSSWYTHWIRGWVGPRAGMDAVVKRNIPSPRQFDNLWFVYYLFRHSVSFIPLQRFSCQCEVYTCYFALVTRFTSLHGRHVGKLHDVNTESRGNPIWTDRPDLDAEHTDPKYTKRATNENHSLRHQYGVAALLRMNGILTRRHALFTVAGCRLFLAPVVAKVQTVTCGTVI